MSQPRKVSSNKSSTGTPTETLIDQEMSKEIGSVPNSPSVVAKLMGYETCQKSRSNCIGDKSPSKGRYDDAISEKKMALVREKFMEAKCMATDENLRQSKQFQDALEVLSANKDSLLKFLQEPNSLLSQNLYNLQSIPPPETKRITVLKPSKMVDNCKFPVESNKKRTKRMGMVNGFGKTPPGFPSRSPNCKSDENPTQPTRIVVLKPSPGRPHDLKSMAYGEDFFREIDHDAARESREVAKSITHHMRANLGGQSVYPNGYTGDGSSFGNLSDSEVISPTSRHSWDYINRFDSPLSSSFSRASYSPESSVCREAKKRLSERWTMMSSNGSYQEPKHLRRNSNTLGEMLALSDIKKTGSKEICTNIDEPMALSSVLSSNLHEHIIRSKSVPLSSTQSCMRLNVDIQDPEEPRSEVPQMSTNGKSSKLLFMGKVSSLFFSGNKRIGREKSSTSQSRKECSSGACASSPESFEDGVDYQDNMKSNLIDKSPPIGSISRTLSWDGYCMGTASSYPLKTSSSSRGAEEEEGEWLFFVRSLLSSVGLDGDVKSDSVMTRWHSSESPLDPSLRDKYVDLNSKEMMQEAKQRRRQSMQKLVFDCVNATLLDISGYGSETSQRGTPYGASFKMVDEVWGRMKDWVHGENKCVLVDDSVDIDDLFIERVIREEVVGKGWTEHHKLENGSLGEDLENKLLDDLVLEAVVEFF